MLNRLKAWAKQLKKHLLVLFYAYRDVRTPWYSKLLSASVVAYAFSPIDLIPDFIPVLGYLDDLILVPLGVKFAMKCMPPAVLEGARARAEASVTNGKPKPKSWLAAGIIIVAWIAVVAWICKALF